MKKTLLIKIGFKITFSFGVMCAFIVLYEGKPFCARQQYQLSIFRLNLLQKLILFACIIALVIVAAAMANLALNPWRPCRGRFRFRRIVAVQEYRANDQRGTDRKLDRQMKLEQVHGRDGRYDDGQRRGESLENVVGKLDHHGHNQTAARLQHDQIPHKQVVAKEETVRAQQRMIVDEARGQAERQAQQAQLHVAHPHRNVRALQHLLKVHARETGQEARAQGGRKANHSILLRSALGRGRRRRRRARIGQLHKHDAQHQQHQCAPLRRDEAFAQNADGEHGRRQDLQLVRHLIGGRVQVGRRHVQQIVLHNVHKRRHTDLQRVERILDDGGVQRVEESTGVFALLVEYDHQTGEQLDQFGHDDGRRTEEHVAGARSAVAHAEPQDGILQR